MYVLSLDGRDKFKSRDCVTSIKNPAARAMYGSARRDCDIIVRVTVTAVQMGGAYVLFVKHSLNRFAGIFFFFSPICGKYFFLSLITPLPGLSRW